MWLSALFIQHIHDSAEQHHNRKDVLTLSLCCRCRLQMLLAALNLLRERLKTQEGSGRRQQVAQSAVTKLVETLGSSLVQEGASAQTDTLDAAEHGNWQQVDNHLVNGV